MELDMLRNGFAAFGSLPNQPSPPLPGQRQRFQSPSRTTAPTVGLQETVDREAHLGFKKGRPSVKLWAGRETSPQQGGPHPVPPTSPVDSPSLPKYTAC